MKILEIKDEFEDEYDFDLVIIIKNPLICVQPYITTRWNLQLKRQLTSNIDIVICEKLILS